MLKKVLAAKLLKDKASKKPKSLIKDIALGIAVFKILKEKKK